MRLWRLTRVDQTALDGAGTVKHGGRYSPPGAPVVNFASEAGLAVLVALRYLRGDAADALNDYVLGWTEIDAIPERVPSAVGGDDAIRDWVADWLREGRSLLAAVRSQVLPEADIVLMNPLHQDASRVPPLATRPFSFAECLHTPPMLAHYSDESGGCEVVHVENCVHVRPGAGDDLAALHRALVHAFNWESTRDPLPLDHPALATYRDDWGSPAIWASSRTLMASWWAPPIAGLPTATATWTNGRQK